MTIRRRDELVTVQNRAAWPVGLRVCRKDTDELGTVVEHNGEIKVKWDGGKTSYYRHGAQANVSLEPVQRG